MHDRLKLLLWNVVWDILLTEWKVADCIGSREAEEEELLCSLCGEGPKSLHHLLLWCPYSRAIWSEFPWQLNIATSNDGSICEWIQKIYTHIKPLGHH